MNSCFYSKCNHLLIVLIVFINFNIKIEAQNFVWAKSMSGANWIDQGRAVTVDSVGNLYITGYFFGTVDFDPGIGIFNLVSSGVNDIFISKLDPNGNLLWAKNIGNSQSQYANAISIDKFGDIYCTGYFAGPTDFDPGASTYTLNGSGTFILKLDASGNFIWAKNITGSSVNVGYSITTDNLGNIYTLGSMIGTTDFNPGTNSYIVNPTGNEDTYIIKHDNLGNFVWVKTIRANNAVKGFSIITDSLGNIFCSGRFADTVDFDSGINIYQMSSINPSSYILKMDNNGNFKWAKKIGGEGCYIKIDKYGNIYSTGSFIGTDDFDPSSNSYNLNSLGNYDIFITKLDSIGDFIWAKSVGDYSSDFSYAIDLDSLSNVYITGSFSSNTLDFDPGPGTFSLSTSSNSSYILKLNINGNFIWANNTGNGVGLNLTLDLFGNIFLTGYYSGTSDFDPSISVFNLTAADNGDIYVLKLGSTISTINELEGIKFTCFPNPVNNNLNIVSNNQELLSIKIFDISSRLLHYTIFEAKSYNEIINTNELLPGMYLLEINTTRGIGRKSFIKN